MSRLLLLNGSHSEIPLIQAAKKLGCEVITSGNNPALPGHAFADGYVNCDFYDKVALLDVARQLKIDYICACANDFGAITAAYIAENMRLPGHDSYEVASLLHNKDRFHLLAKDLALQVPDSIEVHDAKGLAHHGLNFPLIVKPSDLGGGKGVCRVNDETALREKFHVAMKISRSKRVVVQEFIEGTLHSFDSYIIDGRVAFSYSDNEYSSVYPYGVSTSCGPADQIDLVKDILVSDVQRLAAELDLCDGIFHIQYILSVSPAPRPYIIDITRRCSGDFYSVPVGQAIGVDWADWIVRAEMGLCIDFPDLIQRGYHGRHCIMSPANGVVRNITFSNSIRDNVRGEFMMWEPGMRIENHLETKLGVVFLTFSSAEEAREKIFAINDLIEVCVDPDGAQ